MQRGRDPVRSSRSTDLEQAFDALAELGLLAVVTRGPRGADVATLTGVVSVPAHEVEHVVDQNGAGDMFASGFLYGLALGADPVEAAELGSLCAGEIIQHLGARPEVDLEDLAVGAGPALVRSPGRRGSASSSRVRTVSQRTHATAIGMQASSIRASPPIHMIAPPSWTFERIHDAVDPARAPSRGSSWKGLCDDIARASPVKVSTGTAAITKTRRSPG